MNDQTRKYVVLSKDDIDSSLMSISTNIKILENLIEEIANSNQILKHITISKLEDILHQTKTSLTNLNNFTYVGVNILQQVEEDKKTQRLIREGY